MVLLPESCDACERERLRVSAAPLRLLTPGYERSNDEDAAERAARGWSNAAAFDEDDSASATTTGVVPRNLPSLRVVLMSRERCSASRTLQVGGRAVASEVNDMRAIGTQFRRDGRLLEEGGGENKSGREGENVKETKVDMESGSCMCGWYCVPREPFD